MRFSGKYQDVIRWSVRLIEIAGPHAFAVRGDGNGNAHFDVELTEADRLALSRPWLEECWYQKLTATESRLTDVPTSDKVSDVSEETTNPENEYADATEMRRRVRVLLGDEFEAVQSHYRRVRTSTPVWRLAGLKGSTVIHLGDYRTGRPLCPELRTIDRPLERDKVFRG